jgi:hypothetical protein
VRTLLDHLDKWSGTSTELLARLSDLVDDDVKHSRAWPGAPNALTNRLKRLAPSLRESGIEYGDGRLPGSGTRIKLLKKVPVLDRHDRHSRHTGEKSSANGHKTERDDPSEGVTVPDGAGTNAVTGKSAANGKFFDDVTVCDDEIRPLSENTGDRNGDTPEGRDDLLEEVRSLVSGDGAEQISSDPDVWQD